MEKHFTKKEQIAILIIAFIITSALGFRFIMGSMKKPEENNLEILNYLEENIDKNNENDDNIENNDIIMVHISGEVYKPGLVELKYGMRVTDAVELSGGLKKDADLDKINLAKKLVDEEKIYIPRIGEEIDDKDIGGLESISNNDEIQTKININNCTKEDLMSLPGIGTATADKILGYREVNPFNKIEDIMNVSGIGEKKFEAIKELISIN